MDRKPDALDLRALRIRRLELATIRRSRLGLDDEARRERERLQNREAQRRWYAANRPKARLDARDCEGRPDVIRLSASALAGLHAVFGGGVS